MARVGALMSHVIEFFRFVPHDDLISHLANGWEPLDALEGTHHGEHAILMRYSRPGEPPAEPKPDANLRLLAQARAQMRHDLHEEAHP
jgi:hypothetical protein